MAKIKSFAVAESREKVGAEVVREMVNERVVEDGENVAARFVIPALVTAWVGNKDESYWFVSVYKLNGWNEGFAAVSTATSAVEPSIWDPTPIPTHPADRAVTETLVTQSPVVVTAVVVDTTDAPGSGENELLRMHASVGMVPAAPARGGEGECVAHRMVGSACAIRAESAKTNKVKQAALWGQLFIVFVSLWNELKTSARVVQRAKISDQGAANIDPLYSIASVETALRYDPRDTEHRGCVTPTVLSASSLFRWLPCCPPFVSSRSSSSTAVPAERATLHEPSLSLPAPRQPPQEPTNTSATSRLFSPPKSSFPP